MPHKHLESTIWTDSLGRLCGVVIGIALLLAAIAAVNAARPAMSRAYHDVLAEIIAKTGLLDCELKHTCAL